MLHLADAWLDRNEQAPSTDPRQLPAAPSGPSVIVWARGSPYSISACGTVGDVKRQLHALTGVPTENLMLFSEAPQPDYAPSSSTLHLGLGHVSAVPQPVSAIHQSLAQQMVLEERNRRMQSAVALWEQAGSSAAEAQLADGCMLTAREVAQERPWEAAELQKQDLGRLQVADVPTEKAGTSPSHA